MDRQQPGKRPEQPDWRHRRRTYSASGRNTHKPPAFRNKLVYWMLPLVLLFLVVVLRQPPQAPAASSGEPLPPGASYVEEPPIYPADDLRAVIDKCANDQWGAETMDKAELLIKSYIYWQKPRDGSEVPINYLTLLIQRESPDKAEDELLDDLAEFLGEQPSEENRAHYRQALYNVHTVTNTGAG